MLLDTPGYVACIFIPNPPDDVFYTENWERGFDELYIASQPLGGHKKNIQSHSSPGKVEFLPESPK